MTGRSVPTFAQACGMFEEFADPSEPNKTVRACAAAMTKVAARVRLVLDAPSEPAPGDMCRALSDATSDGFLWRVPAPFPYTARGNRRSAVTLAASLCAELKAGPRYDHRHMVRRGAEWPPLIAAHYDLLDDPGVPPGHNATPVAHALVNPDYDGSPGFDESRPYVLSRRQLIALDDLVTETAYSLARVKDIMGPRDESVVRAFEDSISQARKLFPEAVHATKSYIAHPSDSAAETANGLLERIEAVMSPVSSSEHRVRIPASGCTFSNTLRWVTEASKARVELRDACDRISLVLDRPHIRPAPVKYVMELNASGFVDEAFRLAAYHASRSRKGVMLWQ